MFKKSAARVASTLVVSAVVIAGGSTAAHADPTWYTRCVNGLSYTGPAIEDGGADTYAMRYNVSRNSANCQLAVAFTTSFTYRDSISGKMNTIVRYETGNTARGTGTFRGYSDTSKTVSNIHLAVVAQ